MVTRNARAYLPFIFEEDRELLDLYQEEAFYGFFNGIPSKVWLIKYLSNAMHLEEMGDAFVTMDDPVGIDGIVDMEITDENRRIWGVDERVVGIVWVLKSAGICANLNNRDRIRVDLSGRQDIYNVDKVIRYEGMGAEQWVYGITLVPVTQRNG